MKFCRFNKLVFCLPLFILSLCFILIESAQGKETAIKAGDALSDISLLCPFSHEDKQYLGFSNRKTYSLSCIRTDFVLINCFSIYCPVCQSHAEKFNRLYKLIHEDAYIKNNLKIIGIGFGNNKREVDYFRKYYNIPYPLIPDPEYKIHRVFKETRTPLLIIVDKRKNPYRISCILDFNKEPENLLEIIKKEIRKNTSL
jgi:thiol-disulfide isomerase/thioredoxin